MATDSSGELPSSGEYEYDDDDGAPPKRARSIRDWQWWRAYERGDDASQIINASLNGMRSQQEALVDRMRALARAYGCESKMFAQGTPQAGVYSARAPTNVFANVIDSLQADVFRDVMRPMPVVDKGDWRQERRAADLGDVLVELIGAHPPVVEIVAAHRGMVGEADFFQAKFRGVRGILDRLADGVPAERRVHVIISRPVHGDH